MKTLLSAISAVIDNAYANDVIPSFISNEINALEYDRGVGQAIQHAYRGEWVQDADPGVDQANTPALCKHFPDNISTQFVNQARAYYEMEKAWVLELPTLDPNDRSSVKVHASYHTRTEFARRNLLIDALLLAVSHYANRNEPIKSQLLSAVLDSEDLSASERGPFVSWMAQYLLAFSLDACDEQLSAMLGKFPRSEFETLRNLSRSNEGLQTDVHTTETGNIQLTLQYNDYEVSNTLPPEVNAQFTLELNSLLNDSRTLRECLESQEYKDTTGTSVRQILELGVPLSEANRRYLYGQLQTLCNVLNTSSSIAFSPSTTKVEGYIVNNDEAIQLKALAAEFKTGNPDSLRLNSIVQTML